MLRPTVNNGVSISKPLYLPTPRPQTFRRQRIRHWPRRASDFPDLDVPEVEGTVEYHQRSLYAHFDDNDILQSFPNSIEALTSSNPMLYDRRRWGRFRIEGEGAREFLHNKTTNTFKDRRPGEGCDTVFCTAKGKILDLATAYIQRDAVFVMLSPDVQDDLVKGLEKFVFPEDAVTFINMRNRTHVFSLYGEVAGELMERLMVDRHVLEGSHGTHTVFGFMGAPVIVAKGNELDRVHGYTLIVDDAVAGDMYRNLLDAGSIPIGEKEWDVLRIMYGRPHVSEFPLAANPFEVDLYHAVSLDKGCFLGQESIGRVYTRDAVRARLWGIRLKTTATPPHPGSPITASGNPIGSVTSSTRHPKGEGSLALGLLKTKLNREAVDWVGKDVDIQGHSGIIERWLYMSFDFPDGIGSPPSQSGSHQLDAPEISKAEKLQEMQARLDAFMKQKGE